MGEETPAVEELRDKPEKGITSCSPPFVDYAECANMWLMAERILFQMTAGIKACEWNVELAEKAWAITNRFKELAKESQQ